MIRIDRFDHLVLTVAETFRRHGVVGRFVEFYGPGVEAVPVETRATIGNMSPEYGSTVTLFPVDDATLRYLRFTGRSDDQVELVETYAKAQGLWHDPTVEPDYDETLELDLAAVEASLAGPGRPQDRVPLSRAKELFTPAFFASMPHLADRPPDVGRGNRGRHIRDGSGRLRTAGSVGLGHGWDPFS